MVSSDQAEPQNEDGLGKSSGAIETSNLSGVVMNPRKIAEAISSRLETLAKHEETASLHENVDFDNLNDLGCLYTIQGDLLNAEEVHLRALTAKERILDHVNPSIFDTKLNLANVLARQGRFSEAEKMYLEVLTFEERVLGPAHPRTLQTRSNLGVIYIEQGRLQKAEQICLSVLKDGERAFTDDDLSKFAVMNNLGNILAYQDMLEEAELQYQQVLTGREKLLGPDHPLTLETINNLGSIYAKQNKSAEAENEFVRAFIGFDRAFDEDHPSTLDTISNLATVCRDQGHQDQAEKLYLRALSGKETLLGSLHPSTLLTAVALGRLYFDQGNLARSEEMYLRALAGPRRETDSEDSLALSAAKNLRTLYRSRGDTVRSDTMYEISRAGTARLGLGQSPVPSTSATTGISHTWTAYPSLLFQLYSDDSRQALECAACAQYCGRYEEARIIFDSQLSASHTLPIITLQRADMLTAQGCEHERIHLLEQALERPALEQQPASVRLLMELMLADAQFWARGKISMSNGPHSTPDVVELLRHTRKTLQEQVNRAGIESLSDIDVRTVLLYHDMLEWLQTFSNFVLKSDQTLFAFSENDKGNEFKHIRQALVDQRRLRLASLAMLFELKHTKSGAKLKESVDQAFSLCELLEKQSRAPATFRSVLLKTRLAGILKSVDAQRATDISAECTTCLTSIARPTYSSWGEFYPSKALDDEKASIVNSEMLNEEKCDKLLALCKTAVLQENITKANQIYMTARDVAYGWLQSSKGHDSEKLALQKLRTVQEENINFHENHGLAFYLATAIADYLTFLCYRFYDYVAVIEKVEGFERKCPDFAVPNLLEQLYRLAATAAAKRDMKSEQRSYSDKLDDILQKCSFSSDTGGLTDEAILDPDFTHRALSSLGDNLVSIGDKSLELMLRWAGFEWEKNLLSADECTRLFGLADLPQTDVANHLRELDCPELAKSMLGDANTFIESEQFLEAYGRILRWILLPDRLPSRAARLSALKVMLESRLDRVRQFLRKYRELPRYSEAITIEEESSALRELEHLEAAENGMNTHPNRDIEERIQKILVRSYLPALPGAKLEEKHVTDAELETASAECRTLIVSYRDSGYRLNEYQALCQLLRIWWQRHLMFKTVSLEQFLEIVKEAETSFLETKAAIGAADPPEDLMARVKLSTDFGHREHYNYALSATLTGFLPGVKALQSGRSASLAFNSYQSFLFWSLRSKGRAFDDILNLETEVIRTETSPITNRDLPTKLSTTSIQDAEPGQKSIANPVVPMRLSNMLQNLPTGVVIVDFLEVRYAWSEWPLVAMLYRKGQMNFPVRIRGLDMADIKIWVKTNLEKGNNLRGTDSLDIMNELAALLEPLMKASPKSVGNPIQDGETMIICPTGALSRVPIHAIPVNGRPLIERNPVVYCQSLSVLHWLWCKTEQHKLRTRQNPKRTVIHPLPDDYVSTPRMEALSQKLKAHYHHGSDLKTEQISGSISGSALLHYHGIVLFNTQSALDSAMILNERAKSLLRKSRSGWHKVPSGCEVLTPRGIFKVKLDAPALACIIGPKSNMSDISRGDDVLGLPTAMFYAGATGVISTLGQIDDEDGAAFAKEFYDAIWEQKDSLADGSGSVIDLAKAMQAAILRLRSDPAREHRSAAYHWASYILNGFWLLPSDVFTGLD